jgi:hypothetical protein
MNCYTRPLWAFVNTVANSWLPQWLGYLLNSWATVSFSRITTFHRFGWLVRDDDMREGVQYVWLFWKSWGKRLLGRHGGIDQIQLARGMVQWRTFLNRVMNLWVPLKQGPPGQLSNYKYSKIGPAPWNCAKDYSFWTWFIVSYSGWTWHFGNWISFHPWVKSCGGIYSVGLSGPVIHHCQNRTDCEISYHISCYFVFYWNFLQHSSCLINLPLKQ